MKYQKGDLVKVKEFAERPAYWCNDGSMDYLIGNVTEIEDVSCDGFYVKNGKNNYFIRFSDVEPVKSCITLYQTRGVVIGKNNITGKKVMRCTAEDTFDFNTAELVLKRLEMFENEVEVGDVVKIVDTKKMYTTSTDLVRDLANGNVSIMLRYAYTVSPYSHGLKQLENEFRVIAKDGDICLVEAYYSKDFHGGEVFAIDEKGLEKLNVDHMKG